MLARAAFVAGAGMAIVEMLVRREAVIALAAVLLTACGSVSVPSNTAAGVTASSVRQPSSIPTQSPTPALPSAYLPPASSVRSFPTLAPAPPGSCRLPFSDISEARGGFIVYPGGARQDDSASVVALPGNTPGAIGVNPGLAFDAATGSWVPVPLQWLAPSGITYAYMSAGGGIRAVTVPGGESGDVASGGGWSLIATLDDGVFATKPSVPGVWFIPFGQDPYQWIDHGTWQRYYGNALWGVDPSEHLVRHELGNGLETTWGSVLNVSEISGFDAAGEPVVYTGGEQVIHHADGSTTVVWPGTNGLTSSGYVFGDSRGLWFEVDGSSGLVGAPGSGIYLWTQAGGATLVTREPVHVMGPCL